MKYAEWLEIWLDNYIKPSAKKKTNTRYGEIVKQHIAPKVGEYELNELSPIELQKFVSELLISGNLRTGGGLAPNSVNAIISVVQSSLKTAYDAGVVKSYIGDKIKRPKTTEKQITSFTQNEQKKIESAVISSLDPRSFGILLSLYTGLRIGELLALEWGDIDLRQREIHVNKTCYDTVDDNGKFTRITDKPKTSNSIRIIPIPKQLIPYMKEAKGNGAASKNVINSKGKAVSVRSYQKSFSRLLDRLGIEHKGFHALRHTFATRALECGVDVKTVSEILGHKSTTLTLSRYAHSMMEHKREMMNKIGKLL